MNPSPDVADLLTNRETPSVERGSKIQSEQPGSQRKQGEDRYGLRYHPANPTFRAAAGQVIKAHQTKAARAADRSEQHYIPAGIQIRELKALRPADTLWSEYVRETLHLDQSRADELIRIADGRTNVAAVRATQKAKDAKRRPKQISVGHAGSPSKSTALVIANERVAHCGNVSDPGDTDEEIATRGMSGGLRAKFAPRTVVNAAYTRRHRRADRQDLWVRHNNDRF
jgi:hypothetical protein